MFWNNVRTIIEGKDKSFKREFAKFDEYGDVEGLYDLRDMIVSLRDDDILVEFDEIAHYIVDDLNFKPYRSSVRVYKSCLRSNDFLKRAKKILSSLLIPLRFESIHGFIIFEDLEAILMLINFNYFYYSRDESSRINMIKMVFGGDIIRYLSFFTDEFESMGELPSYDDSFFEKLKNMKYEDDRARILEDFLRCGYLSLIIVEQGISLILFDHIKFSAWYLMACNALKRGASKISCEDVVVGFTLTFRLITEDMREFVNATFDEKLG